MYVLYVYIQRERERKRDRVRYIHAYIHTYIHTYMHAYIHTYIHTYLHTYIHTYDPLQHINYSMIYHTIPYCTRYSIRTPIWAGNGIEAWRHKMPIWAFGYPFQLTPILAYPFQGHWTLVIMIMILGVILILTWARARACFLSGLDSVPSLACHVSGQEITHQKSQPIYNIGTRQGHEIL